MFLHLQMQNEAEGHIQTPTKMAAREEAAFRGMGTSRVGRGGPDGLQGVAGAAPSPHATCTRETGTFHPRATGLPARQKHRQLRLGSSRQLSAGAAAQREGALRPPHTHRVGASRATRCSEAEGEGTRLTWALAFSTECI